MEFGNPNPEWGDRQLQLAAGLQAEAESADTIFDFYNYVLEMYVDHPFVGSELQRLARIIEPQDRQLGAAEAIPAAVSFYMGIILGARVADMQGGQTLLDELPKAPLPQLAQKSDDEFHDIHAQAGLFMEKGIEVYETSAAYHPVIEGWIDELLPDVSKQIYLKSGFGIMLHLINGAERIRRYEFIEEALENCDWDAELIKLNSSE